MNLKNLFVGAVCLLSLAMMVGVASAEDRVPPAVAPVESHYAYSPWSHPYGVKYESGTNGAYRPLGGYATFYSGYPGMINTEGNAWGTPTYYYPTTPASPVVNPGRRVFR